MTTATTTRLVAKKVGQKFSSARLLKNVTKTASKRTSLSVADMSAIYLAVKVHVKRDDKRESKFCESSSPPPTNVSAKNKNESGKR